MNAELSLYKTYDDVVVIFVANGVLAFQGQDGWVFSPEGSVRYDSLHQMVHRNYHADKLTQEQLSGLGIALPDFEKYRGLATARWEDNFAAAVPAARVSAAVRSRLESGPRQAWLVLLEDRYETSFGDGEYLYPKAAFWDKPAAEKYVNEVRSAETDEAKRQWYAYTLREVSLGLDRERGCVTAGLGIGPHEHFSVEDVVRLLGMAPA